MVLFKLLLTGSLIFFCIFKESLSNAVFSNSSQNESSPQFHHTPASANTLWTYPSLWNFSIVYPFPLGHSSMANDSNATTLLLPTTRLERHRLVCCVWPVNWWNVTRGSALLVNGAQFEAHLFQPGLGSSMVGRLKQQKSPPDGSVTGPARKVLCTVVFIYAQWCHYSMRAAPAFNALARVFPQIKFLAINVDDYWALKWNLHMFYIPKIKIYINRKIHREFNGTDGDLDALVSFVSMTTGLLPALHTINITSADHEGPVPTALMAKPDYWLVVSWIAVMTSLVTLMLRSTWGQRWKERVVLLWQEHQYMV